MDTEALRAFLSQPHDAIISTNRAGKGPQLSPVWFLWDGGCFIFSTRTSSVKYANLARDPHASVIVNDPVTHTYVTATGCAEIAALAQFPGLEAALTEKYIPAEKRRQYAEAAHDFETAPRVVIVLRPDRVIDRAWDPY